jgi:hypothetical protein
VAADTHLTPPPTQAVLQSRHEGRGPQVVLKSWVRVAAYAVLAVVLTLPLALHPGVTVPAGGDTWVSYWNLWWVGHAVLELRADPNVCPLVHHPYGASLHFHTLNLLPALVVLPVSATLGLAWAYNLLVWAGFALAGLAADRLARSEIARLGVPEAVHGWAGLVGGCAFSFSAYAFMHLLGHLHLVATFWIPWFAFLFLRIARDEDRASVPRTALVLAGTALTSWHYAFFEVLFAGVAVCWMAVARRSVSRRLLARTLGVGALSALLVSPVLVPMLLLGSEAGRVSDPRGDTARFSADLVGFVTPSSLHPVWGPLVKPFSARLAGDGNVTESTVYLGGAAMLLAGVASVLGRRDRGALGWWWCVLLVFACLALGPARRVGGAAVGLPLPAALFAHVPFADIPRVPARFVVVAILAVSVLAACGAARLLERVAARRRIAVGLGLVGLVVFDGLAVPFPTVRVHVPAAYGWLASRCATSPPGEAAILELPIPDDPFAHRERMLYQTVHGCAVFGGALSRGLPPLPFPAVPGFAQLRSLTDGIDDVVRYDSASLGDLSLAALGAYRTRYIVLDKRVSTAEAVAATRRAWAPIAGTAPAVFEDRDTVVYAVPQGPPPSGPALWLDRGWSYLERAADESGERWRWMGRESTLRVSAPDAGDYALTVKARALDRPRRVAVSLDGSDVGTVVIARDPATSASVILPLTPGIHEVDLRSLDGADVSGRDPRLLSIALFEAALVVR